MRNGIRRQQRERKKQQESYKHICIAIQTGQRQHSDTERNQNIPLTMCIGRSRAPKANKGSTFKQAELQKDSFCTLFFHVVLFYASCLSLLLVLGVSMTLSIRLCHSIGTMCCCRVCHKIIYNSIQILS